MLITQQELKTKLHYEPTTGIFTWINLNTQGRKKKEVGYINKGYRIINLDYKHYQAHRLAYLYMLGEWPIVMLDHINLDKLDNRWVNLRPADDSENQCNTTMKITNTSGIKGVSWHKRDKRWMAQITKNNIKYNLGSFTNIHEAELAIKTARPYLHQNFTRN